MAENTKETLRSDIKLILKYSNEIDIRNPVNAQRSIEFFNKHEHRC